MTHPGKSAVGETWQELCARLNELRVREGTWWSRMAADDEALIRVDTESVMVRLRGNRFAEIGLLGDEPQCRMAPEHLLLTHPGARVVLDGRDGARSVRTLEELAEKYAHVRRRVGGCTDRRQTILDRLYRRHSCVMAVDAPVPPGAVDLMALSPAGTVVFFLVRRYADGDLRLKGRGGVVWRMQKMNEWLAGPGGLHWARGLLERCAALETCRSRRYHLPVSLSVYPRTRLLVVDFDHAQRLGGLPELRADFEDGLDRSAAREDIHCIGDAGNISYGTFFSGL